MVECKVKRGQEQGSDNVTVIVLSSIMEPAITTIEPFPESDHNDTMVDQNDTETLPTESTVTAKVSTTKLNIPEESETTTKPGSGQSMTGMLVVDALLFSRTTILAAQQ